MCRRASSSVGTQLGCFAGLIYRSAGIIEDSEAQSTAGNLRPVQASAALGTHQRSRSICEARRWTPGRAPRAGLGLYALRPPGASLVRGVDLTTAAATRLERLRQVLEQRVRRSTDIAPPLILDGVLDPMVTGNNRHERRLSP